MTEEKQAAENWEWGIGEKGHNYYDYQAYHQKDEYEIHIWWDKGHKHIVELIPVTGKDKFGDKIYDRPKEIGSFGTEDEAIKYACDLMEEYN